MYCQKCGAEIPNEVAFCTKCGAAISQNTHPVISDDNAALRFVIPIGCSGWAIAAGYLGLLSVFPILGLLAVITGILAIFDIKKHPEKHGLVRAWLGIVVGGIATVLWLLCLIFV